MKRKIFCLMLAVLTALSYPATLTPIVQATDEKPAASCGNVVTGTAFVTRLAELKTTSKKLSEAVELMELNDFVALPELGALIQGSAPVNSRPPLEEDPPGPGPSQPLLLFVPYTFEGDDRQAWQGLVYARDYTGVETVRVGQILLSGNEPEYLYDEDFNEVAADFRRGARENLSRRKLGFKGMLQKVSSKASAERPLPSCFRTRTCPPPRPIPTPIKRYGTCLWLGCAGAFTTCRLTGPGAVICTRNRCAGVAVTCVGVFFLF